MTPPIQVTGLTAGRMAEIEAAAIVSAHTDGSGHLILTRHDGSTVDAGLVYSSVIPVASTTQQGIAELATNAEAQAGTDTTRTITPAALAFAMAAMGYAPTGSVMAFAGSAAPGGWVLCDGAAVSRTGTYASLYSVIGTTYGVGDGSTTFNLPNLKSRVPVGYLSGDSDFGTLGRTGGSKTNTHNHWTLWSNDGSSLFTRPTSASVRSRVVASVLRGVSAITSGTSTTREDSTYNETIPTLPPFVVMNYIIRF